MSQIVWASKAVRAIVRIKESRVSSHLITTTPTLSWTAARCLESGATDSTVLSRKETRTTIKMMTSSQSPKARASAAMDHHLLLAIKIQLRTLSKETLKIEEPKLEHSRISNICSLRAKSSDLKRRDSAPMTREKAMDIKSRVDLTLRHAAEQCESD